MNRSVDYKGYYVTYVGLWQGWIFYFFSIKIHEAQVIALAAVFVFFIRGAWALPNNHL
jgi:hypothetical protein